MSTFSLLSSRTMFLTREPRIPTHAPTGSTLSFALHAANFHRAIGDLAHFHFKQTTHKIWMAPRNDDLGTTYSVLNRDDIGAEAIADVVIFDHNTFALRHDRFKFSKIENHVRAI